MIAMLFILFNDTDLNVTTMNLHLDRPPTLQDMRSTLLKGLNWTVQGLAHTWLINSTFIPAKRKVQMVKVQQMLDSSLLCNNKPMWSEPIGLKPIKQSLACLQINS